jgi:hypothetical protein
MAEKTALKHNFRKRLFVLVAGLAAVVLSFMVGILDAPEGHAQSSTAAVSPSPIGKKLEFEVASVRQNKTDDKASMNVDPTSGDGMVPTGGLYSARNIVLAQYIAFAYKLTNQQLRSVGVASALGFRGSV